VSSVLRPHQHSIGYTGDEDGDCEEVMCARWCETARQWAGWAWELITQLVGF